MAFDVVCSTCAQDDVLWDEADTVYCSRCAHRTWKADGSVALRTCQDCGEQMDARAGFCDSCASSNPESF
jgi:hypothetical protein